MKEGMHNSHLIPHAVGLRARVGGSRLYAYRLPAPHETSGATYPIVNRVRFIPVNPPLLKVALPLGSALPLIPTFMTVHP